MFKKNQITLVIFIIYSVLALCIDYHQILFFFGMLVVG